MQPGVRPIFCSDDVTKPGMRSLMRHQPVGITIQSGTVVMQGKIGLGCDGEILHSSEDELRYRNLCVMLVGIRKPSIVREKFDDLPGILECVFSFPLASFLDVPFDINASHFFLVLSELTSNDGKQVSGVRKLHFIMKE